MLIPPASTYSTVAGFPIRLTEWRQVSLCWTASGSSLRVRWRALRASFSWTRLHRSGVSIIWIEHIVHALVALVDRLVVLHGGAFIAEGAPDEVIRSPAVREIYMGIPADA